ncbi:MAG TPA: glycosyltransferase, partial [Phycisphaerales bacterium]|nr:glycosyltransferase [Phycisphaerales bacterium]
TLGGAELLMLRTADLLRAHGHEVEIFTADSVPGIRRTAWSYINNSHARSAFAKMLRNFTPNIVHLHNFYHLLSPGILAELTLFRPTLPARIAQEGGGVVMTAHDYHLICPSPGCTIFPHGRIMPADSARLAKWSYLIFNRWDQHSIARSKLRILQHIINYRIRNLRASIDRILAPSRFLRDRFLAHNLPAHWLPNPPPQSASSFQSADRPPHLQCIFVGRIAPEKGLVEFIRALPIDPPIHLDIVGDGPDIHRVQAAAHASPHREHIRFLGSLTHAEALEHIASAHVLVLPSLWFENDPLSLTEALSLSTSLLVSDLGGMREIVNDSAVGFTFTPGNSASLAAALRQVHAAFRAGTLNAFDASKHLSSRSESSYIQNLLDHYAATLASSNPHPSSARA